MAESEWAVGQVWAGTEDATGESLPMESSHDSCRKVTLRSSSWSGSREEASEGASAVMRPTDLDTFCFLRSFLGESTDGFSFHIEYSE